MHPTRGTGHDWSDFSLNNERQKGLSKRRVHFIVQKNGLDRKEREMERERGRGMERERVREREREVRERG